MSDEELLATEWIVDGQLQRDGVTYPDGTRLRINDVDAIKALRFYGVLKTAAETLPPASLEAERAALASENQSLREKLAALEAAQAQVAVSTKGK